MIKKITRIIIALIVLALFMGTMTLSALADTENLPPLPPVDNNGGGGGGSGSYTAPVFKPFTSPLKSGDGSVIGQIEGRDFYSYIVRAEKNGTVGNISYDLLIEGELSSRPADNCWLDVNFLEPGTSGLPSGMENWVALGSFNVTTGPGGWDWKAGTPRFTLKISGISDMIDTEATSYLVRADSGDFQLKNIALDAAGSASSFSCIPPGDTGIFTVVVAQGTMPIQAITPTPAPSPTTIPVQVPENNGMGGFPIMITIFAVGAIAGAGTIFIITRSK